MHVWSGGSDIASETCEVAPRRVLAVIKLQFQQEQWYSYHQQQAAGWLVNGISSIAPAAVVEKDEVRPLRWA